MIISSAFLLALGAAAIYVFTTSPQWSWRLWIGLTLALAVVLFVLLTGGAIRIGLVGPLVRLP